MPIEERHLRWLILLVAVHVAIHAHHLDDTCTRVALTFIAANAADRTRLIHAGAAASAAALEGAALIDAHSMEESIAQRVRRGCITGVAFTKGAPYGRAHLMREAIRGAIKTCNPWSSDVLRGHPGSSEVIRGHPGSSKVIRGHPGSSEVSRGPPGSSVVIRRLTDESSRYAIAS